MEVMPIPCPHFKISIVKRSQGQSAVAGAAYQSGERLFSEYDQRTKFYNKKKELVHAEYSKLLTEKKARYPDYRKARDEMQELLRAQKNIELFFDEEKDPKQTEHSR